MIQLIKMMTIGTYLNPESIWTLDGMCRKYNYDYLVGLLMQSFRLRKFSLALRGYIISEDETKWFFREIQNIKNKFESVCYGKFYVKGLGDGQITFQS